MSYIRASTVPSPRDELRTKKYHIMVVDVTDPTKRAPYRQPVGP